MPQIKNKFGLYQDGVSLLELLIYIAVFSIIAVFLVSIFVVIIRTRATANARFEVGSNLRSASEKIQQSVFDSSLVLTGGTCPLNTLEICIGASPCTGSATTTYQVSGGVMQIREGTSNPFNDITSSLVTVASIDGSSCLFTKVDNLPPAKSAVQIKFKMSYNDGGREELKFSDSAQVTTSLR